MAAICTRIFPADGTGSVNIHKLSSNRKNLKKFRETRRERGKKMRSE